MPPHDDPLDPILRAYEASTPPLPTSVVRDVWRRIAEAETPAPSDERRWLESLRLAFARPAFAAAFVFACVLCGLFAAEIRVSQLHAARSADLRANYLHLIAPLFEPIESVDSLSSHPSP
jgi:hypothetical protein